jgi:hypothetical protein
VQGTPLAAFVVLCNCHQLCVVQEPLKQQVFISHTGQDEGAKTFAASILKPALERAGLKVYMDFSNLKPGQHWKAELVDAATNSQVVVVVLSKSYTSRFWCMLELDLARNGRPSDEPKPKLIIPVCYDEWSVVISGPGEVKRNGTTAQWQGLSVEWSGSMLQQWLEDEDLEPSWGRCVYVERWAANVKAMQNIQHLRRSAFHSKAAELEMVSEVVGEARKAIAPEVDVSEIIGLDEHSNELLTSLATAPLGLWLYGLGGCNMRCMRMHQAANSAARCRWRRQDNHGKVLVLAPSRTRSRQSLCHQRFLRSHSSGGDQP